MLNKNGESGHPSLIPHLKEKAFSFSPLSLLLAVVVLYKAFIMLRCVSSIPTLLSFCHEWMLDLVKCFFCIYQYEHMVFILHFLCVV